MKSFRKIRRRFYSMVGISVLRLVPKRTSLAIGQLLGAVLANVIFGLKPRTREVAERNLAICFPEQTPEQRTNLARASFRELGKLVFEANQIWRADKVQMAEWLGDIEIRGKDVLRRARDKGGVIFATLHLGCWEMVGAYLERDAPLYFLYKSDSLHSVERFVRTGRDSRSRGYEPGTGAVGCPSNVVGVRQLLRACAQGKNVLILPDQVPPSGQGVHAPFFGRPAYTMRLLGRLARHAPVVFVTAERLPRNDVSRYRLHFDEAPPELYDPDPVVSAAATNRMAERLIRRFPHQYFWSYKRFRSCGDDVYRN